MSLGTPRSHGDSAFPGEPGVGPDLAPPFTAPDEDTRWLFGLNRLGFRPGLRRIQGLLTDLGNPERKLRTLVTAGTNGKGSTTRILSRLLQDAGHHVATYTSPHLLGVHERILLADQPLDQAEFSARVRAIRPLVEKHGASWFETLTALAVQVASEAGVAFFCCETGLGGRLDATNALPAVATLIATVDLDHQNILGETRTQIANEKLGLLKTGVPLFCGVDNELRPQFFQAAVTRGCPCYFLDELARWEDPNAEDAARAGRWNLTLRAGIWQDIPDPGTAALRRNVALALLSLATLAGKTGDKLLPQDVPASLGNLFLPGRYQRVLRDPEWIFDTAHNTQALAGTLAEFLRSAGRGRKIVLLGGMGDKRLDPSLGPLLVRSDAVVAAPLSLPRSRQLEDLREMLGSWGISLNEGQPGGKLAGVLVLPDLTAALARLAADLKPEDQVLVTGSCFTVAEVLWRLGFKDLDETRRVQPAGPRLAVLKERP